jgi:hypothetical protein
MGVLPGAHDVSECCLGIRLLFTTTSREGSTVVDSIAWKTAARVFVQAGPRFVSHKQRSEGLPSVADRIEESPHALHEARRLDQMRGVAGSIPDFELCD